MSHKKEIEVHKKSSTNTLLVGALMGAGAGLVAAMLIQRRAKKQERESMLTVSEGIQLGLLIFGLFRAISSLGDSDK
jgi:gas vesicle protein